MKYWQSWKKRGFMLASVGMVSISAWSDVRSTNSKDPYSLRYSHVALGKTVLELCGPKGCRALGPIELMLDQAEVEDLRKREKFEHGVNKVAGPILFIGMPIGEAIRAAITIKVTVRLAEKYLPYITTKIFEKFGRSAVINVARGASMTSSSVQAGLLSNHIEEEFLNSDENEAALEVLSPQAIAGKDIHVDFSIEQLARHLEADMIEKQRAKELVEEQKENPSFDWPI